MNSDCPKCGPRRRLKASFKDKSLFTYQCGRCKGLYLPSTKYLPWREARGESLPEEKADLSEVGLDDWNEPEICPECEHVMLKYHVGRDVTFKVDFCGACNGFWFDPKNWEVLESNELHGKLDLFFTKGWQQKVRRIEKEERREDILRKKLGDEAYSRVVEFRNWLRSSLIRSEILDYLQCEDEGE